MADREPSALDLLPGAAVTLGAALGGSDRSAVRRGRATRPDGSAADVVVKTFDDPAAWAREVAALTVLPDHAPVPRLLAAHADPPTAVMSHLDGGGSVADALLGGSAAAAAGAAVLDWARALADLHAAGLGARAAYAAAHRARGGAAEVPLTSLAGRVPAAIADLAAACAPLGVDVPDALAGAFRAEAARLDRPGAAALSPGDVCPDNNVVTPDGVRLVDFEHAEWRHVAWDAAYLLVPWPTCWCAWRLPDALAAAAVARYRAVLAPHLPYVATDAFDRDLAAAAGLWSVLYSSWFLPLTLAGDPVAADGLPAPRRRALLLHRLATSERRTAVPVIADFAGRLRAALVGRWGEVPLPLAPALAGGA
ncbi:hypothetical protein [Pilimelia anulata]|nr:hypothetical protein [Pilimelia anulata]